MRLSSWRHPRSSRSLLSPLAKGHPLARTSQYDASMFTLKQAFEHFFSACNPTALVAIKIKIFKKEATSALAGFHADPPTFGDQLVSLEGGKPENPEIKPSEHGENQQKSHCTGKEPRSHWWEASTLTSGSSLLPRTFPNII